MSKKRGFSTAQGYLRITLHGAVTDEDRFTNQKGEQIVKLVAGLDSEMEADLRDAIEEDPDTFTQVLHRRPGVESGPRTEVPLRAEVWWWFRDFAWSRKSKT